MSTFFDPTGKQPTDMYFYFGPNHYKTLTALDKGREEKWELNNLVYLGWPLIRWINKWITINVFDWLSGWGLGMGVVLLLLTIMVKVVVFPATWKTYMSSAKMRVLKPKIDEINKKYPKQEDANEETARGNGTIQSIRCKPDGRLFADACSIPYPDGIVHVCAERYRTPPAEFPLGGRLIDLRRIHHFPVPYSVLG